MKDTEHNGAKRGGKGIIALAVIIIVICGIITGISLFSLVDVDTFFGREDPAATPPLSQTEPVGSDHEDNIVVLTAYTLDVSGCDTITSAVGLAETTDAYGTTPAFVVIGQKRELTKEEKQAQSDYEKSMQAKAEGAEDETEKETGLPPKMQLQVDSVKELLSVVRAASVNWLLPYEDINTFFNQGICIHSDKYVVIIGDERYAALADIFEEAAKDPAILDLEDITARLSEFRIEEG